MNTLRLADCLYVLSKNIPIIFTLFTAGFAARIASLKNCSTERAREEQISLLSCKQTFASLTS
ncbi:MAG: hypothetical protein HY033_11255 [Ignavibacteriae bacterium]|nr:hypothetical protein [Ignavibacteria bacterium]MBI3365476.1 hypothetical protein [Ignavibacteriota bacterium]